MQDWLKHKASGIVATVVTAIITAISTKYNIGLTPDQCLKIGLTISGGLFIHGAANSHAENSQPEVKQ